MNLYSLIENVFITNSDNLKFILHGYFQRAESQWIFQIIKNMWLHIINTDIKLFTQNYYLIGRFNEQFFEIIYWFINF